mgnify:CR=1 FL=1
MLRSLFLVGLPLTPNETSVFVKPLILKDSVKENNLEENVSEETVVHNDSVIAIIQFGYDRVKGYELDKVLYLPCSQIFPKFAPRIEIIIRIT